MKLEAKKWNVVQLISSIEDEGLIDEISSKIIQLIPHTEAMSDGIDLSKYLGQIEEKLDLEKIKSEQSFSEIDKQKLERLAEEADIQESIEDLIQMLG